MCKCAQTGTNDNCIDAMTLRCYFVSLHTRAPTGMILLNDLSVLEGWLIALDMNLPHGFLNYITGWVGAEGISRY